MFYRLLRDKVLLSSSCVLMLPSPPDVPAGIRFHSNSCLPFHLSNDVSLKVPCLEGSCGKPSSDDVVRTRGGSDGVPTGLPDAGGEIVALRVWHAVPVHDELIVKR